MFHNSVVASVLFFAIVFPGCGPILRLNSFIKMAGSVLDLGLDSVQEVMEQRTVSRQTDSSLLAASSRVCPPSH